MQKWTSLKYLRNWRDNSDFNQSMKLFLITFLDIMHFCTPKFIFLERYSLRNVVQHSNIGRPWIHLLPQTHWIHTYIQNNSSWRRIEGWPNSFCTTNERGTTQRRVEEMETRYWWKPHPTHTTWLLIRRDITEGPVQGLPTLGYRGKNNGIKGN